MASVEIPGIRDELTVGLFRVGIELEEMLRKCQALLEQIDPERSQDGPLDD